MTDTLDNNAPASRPEPLAPIATARNFSRAMLGAARELYRDEPLRREVAKRIS